MAEDAGERHTEGGHPKDWDADDWGSEDEGDAAESLHTGLPPRVEEWRRRSAIGAIMSGFAFGLKEALEPEPKEPAIVMQTSGLPPKDLPVEASLDQAPPRHSVVRIRPWLLETDGEPDEAGDPDTS